MRTLPVLLLVLLAGTAAAHPVQLVYDPPPPPPPPAEPARPAIDWSTWFRLGFGVQPGYDGAAARSTTPMSQPARDGEDAAFEVGFGAEATISAGRGGDVRVGPWLEVRGIHDVVVGGELVVQRVPKSIDMFLYKGQGVLMLRAGANTAHWTGQVAYGYLAPWKLFDTPKGATRYTIGVRVVGSFTREFSDPRDWVATIGLETEPFGALRYLLGIRSLY